MLGHLGIAERILGLGVLGGIQFKIYQRYPVLASFNMGGYISSILRGSGERNDTYTTLYNFFTPSANVQFLQTPFFDSVGKINSPCDRTIYCQFPLSSSSPIHNILIMQS
ncbi:hypothetical protein ACMFMG_009192 [Clarireedia jacksonii]